MRTRLRIAMVAAGVIALSGTPASPDGASATDAFPVPGVDFSRLTLEEGSWCRYLVVDEALEQVDSTEIYVGVPTREETVEGTAYWVELETRPLGTSSAEAEVLKMLVLERITDFSEGDSLGDYVLKLYNKTGTRPPREEDPRRYKDFSMVLPTTDSSWVSTPETPVGTPAGDFSCTKKSRAVNNDQEIKTGSVKIIKKARDDYTVWFSPDIPVFHLARCEIVRFRQTETVPRIAGIPASGRKDSKTTAELLSYGYDAKPIVSLESLRP